MIVEALRSPADVIELDLAGWSELVRQARSTDLLGRFANQLQNLALMDQVPAAPRRHLESAQMLAAGQNAEVRREVKFILDELRQTKIPVVVLKGAGYVFANPAVAAGRMFSDIDILVPTSDLPSVEATLMQAGWASSHHSAYDQRYYRQWMHELPPMQHVKRGAVLDVHHAILPLTSRIKMRSHLLWEFAEAVPEMPGLYVLSNVDMLLHSMTHLFCNEEFSHGLRDLSDIDLLIRDFGTRPAFWQQLPRRAAELGLSRPLFHGLRQAQRILGSSVPQTVLIRPELSVPSMPVHRLMDWLWASVLGHVPTAKRGIATTIAESLLYLRAHWLRMPLWLLVIHVFAKIIRLAGDAVKTAERPIVAANLIRK